MLKKGITLRGLEVLNLRTEVAWDDAGILSFFKAEGFRPAPRLCLETVIDRAP